MKKLLAVLVALLVMPFVFATDFGVGIGVDIETEDFAPLVWDCGTRIVYDDNTEPGRETNGSQEMTERLNNYAFEGEEIQWNVLVMDKNGINKVEDVYATVGSSQGAGNPIEVNCVENLQNQNISDSCNARILEENITVFNAAIMRNYICTLNVETPVSMPAGEYWITVEAIDLDGLTGTMDENEYWFLNPVVSLGIDGSLVFSNVRPGTASYSETILVENEASMGSGVLLDMFITGTDFYDSANSGAMCPTSNVLELSNFRYYVVNGAYSSRDDVNVVNTIGVARDTDAEGYTNIEYGIGFNNPTPFYNSAEILQAQVGPLGGVSYYQANILAPGAEMALTFKLSLPEPCNGDFDTGTLSFWAEAI